MLTFGILYLSELFSKHKSLNQALDLFSFVRNPSERVLFVYFSEGFVCLAFDQENVIHLKRSNVSVAGYQESLTQWSC